MNVPIRELLDGRPKLKFVVGFVCSLQAGVCTLAEIVFEVKEASCNDTSV